MLGSGGWIALTLFASPLERDTCKHEFPFSLRRTSDYTRLRRDVAGPRLTASSHEKTPAIGVFSWLTTIEEVITVCKNLSKLLLHILNRTFASYTYFN